MHIANDRPQPQNNNNDNYLSCLCFSLWLILFLFAALWYKHISRATWPNKINREWTISVREFMCLIWKQKERKNWSGAKLKFQNRRIEDYNGNFRFLHLVTQLIFSQTNFSEVQEITEKKTDIFFDLCVRWKLFVYGTDTCVRVTINLIHVYIAYELSDKTALIIF